MLTVLFSCIFGLIVGSFLNVVINRLKLKETLNGRSHCPQCKKELKVVHLVPLFSYLFLGGRCAYCKKKISIQYPLVEAVTALSFTLIALQYLLAYIDILFLWTMASMLIVIAVYDLKHFIIPDKIVFPGVAIAAVYALYKDFNTGCAFSWDCALVSGLLGVLVIAGFFLAQYVVSQGKWIGFGDVKFGIFLGLLAGLVNSILLLFLAYMTGAVVGVFLVAIGKKELTSKMPFGTFLAAMSIVVILWGSQIANWYLNLIGL